MCYGCCNSCSDFFFFNDCNRTHGHILKLYIQNVGHLADLALTIQFSHSFKKVLEAQNIISKYKIKAILVQNKIKEMKL